MKPKTPARAGESKDMLDDRRTFISLASTATMTTGLVAGYGMLGYMAGRFLYSAASEDMAWQFVTDASRMKVGDVMQYQTPAGHKITLTRRSSQGAASDFLALSSTCPHLGCQVHWEPQNSRFFCPCHNGAFDVNGRATAGPPADAGQFLPQYDLRIDDGLVFILAPTRVVGSST